MHYRFVVLSLPSATILYFQSLDPIAPGKLADLLNANMTRDEFRKDMLNKLASGSAIWSHAAICNLMSEMFAGYACALVLAP